MEGEVATALVIDAIGHMGDLREANRDGRAGVGVEVVGADASGAVVVHVAIVKDCGCAGACSLLFN